MSTIVVLGSVNMDVVATAPRFPQPGETISGTRFVTAPGGKGANQAVAAARLGAHVVMIGRVGSDVFGKQLLDSLKGNGVDTSGIVRDRRNHSGIAHITLNAQGQNTIIVVPGANGACGQAEVVRAVAALAPGSDRGLEGASALMLQLEIPVEVSLAAAREAVRLDVPVILDPAPANPIPEELFKLASYLTPNETEAQALVGFPVTDAPSAQRAARQLLRRGAGCVVIKMGGLGAYYACTYGGEFLPALAVEVVDTVAAGDAFNGALAVALAEGVELRDAMTWAMAAGALAVTKPGAQDSMPHRGELEEFLKGR
ncbi:MAG: ribokinase [Chloroflexota bacterium]|nr:ribokinase [Chloroflexota bacterium]